MRRIVIIALLLWGWVSAQANQRAQGFCTVGGKAVITQGLTSTNDVQASYPQCTVTVYLHGTQTIATIYSDNNSTPTPLTNPFTANTDGSWGFYAALGHYDVVLSGGQKGGFTVPFTLSDVLLQDCSMQQCGGQGGNLPDVTQIISGDGLGNGVGMPEKGTTLVTGTPNTATVAWDEDYSQGRFDCRNTKYAGGCLGSTPGAAMQAFSDALVCYEALTGKHPRTTFPPATIAVGTVAYPTLKLPSGGIYRGGGGWGFATDATQFQATYNNHRAVQFSAGLTSTTNCSDGVPHTASLGGGSYDGFSEAGCGNGGCVNVPGDSGNYPFGGPAQDGISITDPDSTVGKAAGVYARNNGADGVLCNPQDGHCYEVGGSDNNEYFYFGIDVAGQNYQFGAGECHGDVVVGGLDAMNEGPFETYGTFMTLGWEYGHIAGICWSGGLTNLGHYFSQIEEIGVIHTTGGNTEASADSGRIDAPRGDGIYELSSGKTTWHNPRVIAACRTNGTADYLVFSVATTTPGSGQTPGTYLLTGSDGTSQISVIVNGSGVVAATPTVTVHGRGMSSTPPTYTLSAGGTPATFTATMQPVFYLTHQGGGLGVFYACDYVDDQSSGNNTWVSPQLSDNSFFGASYATGDIASITSETWITPHGNNGGDGVIWDTSIVAAGYSAAREQRVVSADKNENNGGLPASGSTLNLYVLGGHVQMTNSSPTTLTNITGGTIMSDLWITGDGFTTMPEVTTNGVFGAANCSTYDQLLQAGHLYHYLLTSGVIFSAPAIYTEQCDAINRNTWDVNWDGNPGSVPTLEQQGILDVVGSAALHPIVNALSFSGSQSGGTPGPNGVASINNYVYVVWVGDGKMVSPQSATFNQCLPLPGFINNPCFQNVFIHLPQNWTRYQLYRNTATDSIATVGLILDVTAANSKPQPAGQINWEDTRVAPINSTVIPSTWFSATVTGTLSSTGMTIPTGSSFPGVQGQMIRDEAGGFDYYCDSDDHWKRAPVTWASF